MDHEANQGPPDGDGELERIRQEVLARYPKPRQEDLPRPGDHAVPTPDEGQMYPAGREHPTLPSELSPEFMQSPTVDIHTWHGIWVKDVPVAITSHRRYGRLVVALKRFLRKFVKAPIADLFDRQRVYNTILVHNIAALQESVRILAERSIPALIQRNDALYAVQDQRQEGLTERLDALTERLESLKTTLDKTAQEILSHVSAVQADLRVQDRDTVALLEDGHAELRQALTRLQWALDEPSRRGAPETISKRDPAAGSSPRGADMYIAFEELYRGREETIREKQRFYLPYFQAARLPVLDMGAGRGEFLELCAANRISAYGIDADAQMAARAKSKGLDARHEDLFTHLGGLQDGSLGGIFMAQVIEHLPRERLFELARLAHAKLSAGSRLAVESVNPLSPMAVARNFYLDLTHERPVHPEGLRFLLQASGFSDVEIAFLSPFPAAIQLAPLRVDGDAGASVTPLIEAINERLARLNDLLFGHQDFAVVAVR